MQEELRHEIRTLYQLRDSLGHDVTLRDEEISRLVLERSLLEEEKAQLKGQVESITQKSIESLEFQTALFSLCETLQQKLNSKEAREAESLKQLEYLVQKTQVSNLYASESREQIELLQREVRRLESQLGEEQDKNLRLMAEYNEIYVERRN